MAVAQAGENHGDEWGLTWYFRWRIYSCINSKLILLTKFTGSSRSTEVKDILMEHLLNDHEDCPNQHKNSHKLCDETWHPVVNMMGSQWNWWENDMIKISQWRESHCRTKILASEEVKKSKRAGLWESQPAIRVWKLTIWVR